MFGYVTICKPELRVKEFYEFRAFYCGLCRTLRGKYGLGGQMTLTYDMTFLVMLLTSLYECPTAEERHHCLIHPVRTHTMLQNEVTEYGAALNIALTWQHFKDDWKDERSAAGLAGMKFFGRRYREVVAQYPRQCGVIEEKLAELAAYEQDGQGQLRGEGLPPGSLDAVSGCFGGLMAELFVMKQDEFEETLREMGFYLGKFIYLMDAYDDLEKDEKSGSYNPLRGKSRQPGFEEDVRLMLNLMMAECTRAFERLPLIKDIDILRNILYNGVWSKYEKIQKERNQNV